MISWVGAHAVEILGVIFSIGFLIFSIHQNILLWPLGITSALLYMVVFYQSKFYADMGLNAYYVIISIYGWLLWRRGSDESGVMLSVSRIGKRHALILLVITALAFAGIGIILDRFTDSPVPYWDAFTTALSITATWMLARKILENWILWIIVDAVSMALYLYRGLYPTLFLFAIYTTMAVIGYMKWKRSYKSRAQ